jgi:hypothetical protein
MENRSGLIVAATLTNATGTAGRKAAEETIVRHSPGAGCITLGGRLSFIRGRHARAQRHAAHRTEHQRPAFRHRRSHHAASRYAVSQPKGKRIEEPFGWGKSIGGLARPMLRGVKKLGFKFTLMMARYDPTAKARRGRCMNRHQASETSDDPQRHSTSTPKSASKVG